MARKTKEAAATTREELLDAAELCFLEQGVSRSTLDQIASRAGYTKGAVYWHFKNKYEVLEAVMDRIELPLYPDLEKLAADTEWPLQALRIFYKDAFEQLSRDIHARNAIEITQLRCEMVEETRPIFARMQKTAGSIFDRQLETFKRAQRLEHLRDGLNAENCARTMHFIIQGALRDWVLNPKSTHIQREGLAALETALASFAVNSSVLTGKGAAAPARSRAGRKKL